MIKDNKSQANNGKNYVLNELSGGIVGASIRRNASGAAESSVTLNEQIENEEISHVEANVVIMNDSFGPVPINVPVMKKKSESSAGNIVFADEQKKISNISAIVTDVAYSLESDERAAILLKAVKSNCS